MNIYRPYTYLIGWTEHNKWYYGVRWRNVNLQITPHKDFWIKYFTSSNTVKKLINQYGDPDIKQIRKTFNTIDEARNWEHKVLLRLNVINDEKWINKSNGKSIPAMPGELNPMWGRRGKDSPNYGREVSKETRSKLSVASKKNRGEKASFYGKKHTLETKQKMSNSAKGRTFSKETREKMTRSAKNRTISNETRQKISESTKGENNPMYGKRGKDSPMHGRKHINNGKICKRLPKGEPLPDGWVFGRL
jgi:hypothetical protein